VGDSRLHEAVCRQRQELWVAVGYMNLCGQTRNEGDSWLHEAVCIQRPELWVTVS